jgi:hypothetical protein
MYDMPTGHRTNTLTRILAVLAVAVAAVAALVVLVSCAGTGRDAKHRSPAGTAALGDAALGSTGPGGNGTGDTGLDVNPDVGAGGEPSAPPGNGAEPGDGAEPGNGSDGGEVETEEATEELVPVEPSPEDCVSYDPAILQVQNLGETGWRMISGNHAMALYDTYGDAADAIKVARQFTRSCFIGRSNTRPDRYAYIVRYWKNPSGLPLGEAPTFDCVTYDPAKLKVKKDGDLGWRLLGGDDPLLLLSSAPDAERARLVASANSKLCFIGRGNDRPDPDRYITEYWRQ